MQDEQPPTRRRATRPAVEWLTIDPRTSTGKLGAAYLRISKDSGERGLGVARQREDCEALALREGVTLVAIVTDNDVSAYSGKPRPGYEALLKMVEERKISAILAYHSDRLHRSPVELERYLDLTVSCAVETMTVQRGGWNLDSAEGQLVARQMGAVARYEVDQSRARIKRALRQRAEQGLPSGGRRAFGYTRTGEQVPEEAAAIVAAYEEIEQGGSLNAVARRWREAGFTTTAGNVWRGPLVRLVLQRERNIGIRTQREGPSTRGKWEPLVTSAQWQRVYDILSDPDRQTHNGAPPRHLLTRIAQCGVCLRTMVAMTRGGGKKVYRCTILPEERRGETHVIIPTADLDVYVVDYLLDGVAGSTAAFTHAEQRAPEPPFTEEELDEAEAQVFERIATVGSRVSQKAIDAALLRISVQREELRRWESFAIPPEATDLQRLASDDPRREWESLTFERRRNLIRELVEVVVLPTGRARAPLTERVSVTLDLSA